MPTTDPTFYRSPGAAVAAAPEQLAYVAAFDPAGQENDAMAVVDCDPDSSDATAGWSAGPSCRPPATSCTTSAGTPAPARCATRATTTARSSAATSLVPGLRSSRTYVLDTKPDPRKPGGDAHDRGRASWPPRPDTPGRTPCTADPAGSSCPPGRRQRRRRSRRGRADRPRHVRGDRAVGDRPGTAVLRLRRLVAPHEDTVMTSEWATPSMIENGLNPEDLLGRKFGHHLNFWSLSERQADPARRPRRRAPDGARAAARPRPSQDVGLRRRGDQRRGPVGVGVAVAPRRRPVGGRQGDHHPRRARRRRRRCRPR